MKLSVFSPVFNDVSLEEMLKKLHELGVQAVELGCGGYPGTAHIKPNELIGNQKKIDEVKALLKKYEIEISAFSCHGNGVHPDKEIAASYHKDFENACALCEAFGIDTIVTFSGCPGGSKDDKMPNWVTCRWPNEYGEVLEYQWNEVLIPYWKKAAEYAKSKGVKKIAFEMHPGFCVYNPATLLRLRDAVGDIIGANFDPSHLFWQGIDPVYAIRSLEGAIYHFHAKDTKIDDINCKTNGVLDTRPYGDEIHRSWIFRSVGYGHDYQIWKDMMSTLRLVGYDGAISIEHEDSLMSPMEGLTKAVEFLKEVMIFEKKGEMWWV